MIGSLDSKVESKKNSGFTLVEITIAVSLLGVAFTTLVGLEMMYAKRAILDRNLTQAALATQYLLTNMETERRPPENGEQTQPLAEALEKAGYFQELPDDSLSAETFAGWDVTTKVDSLDIATLQDALRKVQITVQWGPGANENYTITYFMRNETRARSSAGQ